MERLLGLLQPERQDLTAIVVFAIFAGVLYLATPLAADALVNSLAFGANQGIYTQALIVLTLGLFGFLLLLGLIRGAQYFVTELIMRRLFVRLTADMAHRLPRVRMSALDQKLGPDLVNRFFDVVTVQKAASLLLLDGLNLVLGAFIGLLLLGVYHPFLLLFDLLLIAALSLVLFGFGRGAVRTSVAESYAKHDVASWLEQVAMFPYLFKSEGASRLAEAKANRLAETYLDARAKHYRIVLRQIGGLLGLQALASASLLGVGGFLVLDGQLTLGQLVAAELIVSAIVSNLASLGKHAELLYDALAAVDKIGYVVDLPIDAPASVAEADSETTCSLHDVAVDRNLFQRRDGLCKWNGMDVGWVERDHAAELLLLDELDRGSPETQRQHLVVGGGFTAPLQVSEHERAGLLAGLGGNLIRDLFGHPAQAF